MGGKYLSLVIVQAGRVEGIRGGLLESSVLFSSGVLLALQCSGPGSADPPRFSEEEGAVFGRPVGE